MLKAHQLRASAVYNAKSTAVNTSYGHPKTHQPYTKSPKNRLKATKATKRMEENGPCLDDVENPAEVDTSASVEDEHGNFNDSDIERSANEVDAAEDSNDLDGLDDLDHDFNLDDMGIGDQTDAVEESDDVPPRAPSPTPPSPHSIDPYGDDMDDVWERDKLERRELLALQEHDEDSEDEDEEMGSGNEHEDEQRDQDIESGTGPDEEIGSGNERGRNDDMDSEAGSDEDEKVRRLSSELSPALESGHELPRALDCSDSETDSHSDEEEGQGTTLEREPWFPSGAKYACQYNNWIGECNHQTKMSDGKDTNEEALQYIKAQVLTKFRNSDGSLGDTANQNTSELEFGKYRL